MNSLPAAFSERMKKQLQDEADAFFQALQTPSPVSIRINPDKLSTPHTDFLTAICGEAVPWSQHAWYLNERPVFTLDPCFHGGAYYVQEASSMFLEHILRQILPQDPVRMLDLCAAPGGKTTLAASCLPAGSLLVANEVIRSRAAILKENVIRWGQDNLVVSSNDPGDFGKLKSAFDVILTDAPCSGEGMFRKDEGAIAEWNENNLLICRDRQKRILSDIMETLKPGGYLIYSTCTYNRGENEEIAEWLVKQFPLQSIPVTHAFPGIVPADSATYGYHFYPHKIKGEGFFISVFRKTDGETPSPVRNKKTNNSKPVRLPEEVQLLLSSPADFTIQEKEHILNIIPAKQEEFITLLENNLRILYKGCEIAECNQRKLKLLHPFALYKGLDKTRCNCRETSAEEALRYLKKEDISTNAPNGEWVLISHQSIGLGWGKSVGNRLNNYFPKEWRIRMDIK